MSKRFALLVKNTQYEDAVLTQLPTLQADISGFADQLRATSIGGFDQVECLIDQPFSKMYPLLAEFFAERQPDDLLLLYFSGHGVLDSQGRFYLAVRDTQRRSLSATAFPAHYITDWMNDSRSRRQVLILDCLHSAAFPRGTKGVVGTPAIHESTFEGSGYGRVVLTATSATQFAWADDQLSGSSQASRFTHFLVEGLRTGAADLNQDGRITIDEWYEYGYHQVSNNSPEQEPRMWLYRSIGGEIIIANAPTAKIVAPPPLPPQILVYANPTQDEQVFFNFVEACAERLGITISIVTQSYFDEWRGFWKYYRFWKARDKWRRYDYYQTRKMEEQTAFFRNLLFTDPLFYLFRGGGAYLNYHTSRLRVTLTRFPRWKRRHTKVTLLIEGYLCAYQFLICEKIVRQGITNQKSIDLFHQLHNEMPIQPYDDILLSGFIDRSAPTEARLRELEDAVLEAAQVERRTFGW